MPLFNFFKNILPINPRRGEVAVKLNGQQHILRLSLAALAYLENLYEGENILMLTKRFARDGLSAKDVHHILQAGLMGGLDHNKDMPAHIPAYIDVNGGFEQASCAAAKLLERAFINE